MASGWQRLAEFVSKELADQHKTWTWLSREAPIGQTTLRMIRNATYHPDPDNWRLLYRVESALGWEPGSVHRIVTKPGGAPVRKSDLDLAYIQRAWPRLSPEARRRLLRATAEEVATAKAAEQTRES